ncbi:hypothetical protein J4450_06155 [Candidatus Micrarchaeota archaeon]|nr:hypothetical protein [Candidatus Micrarchaeota archaeon]
MNMHFIGLTLEFAGTLLISISVLLVHSRVVKEHKIDESVVRQIKKEKWVTVSGIILIIIGYLLQVPEL